MTLLKTAMRYSMLCSHIKKELQRSVRCSSCVFLYDCCKSYFAAGAGAGAGVCAAGAGAGVL